MFVGQPIGGANTWMTLNSIGWHGSTITIEASLWTNPNDANRNPSARPMLLVQLIPPASRRALAPVTPPGHYQVDLIIHRFADTTSNDWYTAGADEKQHAEVDVK